MGKADPPYYHIWDKADEVVELPNTFTGCWSTTKDCHTAMGTCSQQGRQGYWGGASDGVCSTCGNGGFRVWDSCLVGSRRKSQELGRSERAQEDEGVCGTNRWQEQLSPGKSCAHLCGFLQSYHWNKWAAELQNDKEFTSCVWNSHLFKLVILNPLISVRKTLHLFCFWNPEKPIVTSFLSFVCDNTKKCLRAPAVYKSPGRRDKSSTDTKSHNNALVCAPFWCLLWSSNWGR